MTSPTAAPADLLQLARRTLEIEADAVAAYRIAWTNPSWMRSP